MAVFMIPVEEMRRADLTLKQVGDSAVVSGLWAPSDDAARVPTLFVVERVEGGVWISRMGVEPDAA